MSGRQIIPVTPDRVPDLLQAARADNHLVMGLGYVLERDGVIRGYFGQTLPMMALWSHTGNQAQDSFRLVKKMIAEAPQNFLAACDPASPFYPFMPRLGFNRLANVDVFLMNKNK